MTDKITKWSSAKAKSPTVRWVSHWGSWERPTSHSAMECYWNPVVKSSTTWAIKVTEKNKRRKKEEGRGDSPASQTHAPESISFREEISPIHSTFSVWEWKFGFVVFRLQVIELFLLGLCWKNNGSRIVQVWGVASTPVCGKIVPSDNKLPLGLSP